MKWQQFEEQETKLEDASWKYNPLKKLDGEFLRAAFKEGAKWQAKRMYSEEEVGEILYNAFGEYGKHYDIIFDGDLINKLFEQFKNK